MEVRILASDLDTDVLARAQQAVYPEESIAEIDGPRQPRHFLRGRGENAGLVQVKPSVRGMVTFRQINLVEEPWAIYTHFDAIFCRNVIIYFDRETQRRLFHRMAQYLAPDGLLFVGHTESLHSLGDLLVPVDHSVYRARTAALS
jgi:chemotaxis protein methyltransferase CheR